MEANAKRGKKKSVIDHTYFDYSTCALSQLLDGARTTKRVTFPMKLHAIVSKPEYSHIICWMPHGRSWKILDKGLLVGVLKENFRHECFSSFNRSVNGWGFKRLMSKGPDCKAYYHELFLRGRPELTQVMTRLVNPGIRLPDQQSEPNFYEISKRLPLPDDKISDTAKSSNGTIAESNKVHTAVESIEKAPSGTSLPSSHVLSQKTRRSPAPYEEPPSKRQCQLRKSYPPDAYRKSSSCYPNHHQQAAPCYTQYPPYPYPYHHPDIYPSASTYGYPNFYNPGWHYGHNQCHRPSKVPNHVSYGERYYRNLPPCDTAITNMAHYIAIANAAPYNGPYNEIRLVTSTDTPQKAVAGQHMEGASFEYAEDSSSTIGHANADADLGDHSGGTINLKKPKATKIIISAAGIHLAADFKPESPALPLKLNEQKPAATVIPTFTSIVHEPSHESSAFPLEINEQKPAATVISTFKSIASEPSQSPLNEKILSKERSDSTALCAEMFEDPPEIRCDSMAAFYDEMFMNSLEGRSNSINDLQELFMRDNNNGSH